MSRILGRMRKRIRDYFEEHWGAASVYGEIALENIVESIKETIENEESSR